MICLQSGQEMSHFSIYHTMGCPKAHGSGCFLHNPASSNTSCPPSFTSQIPNPWQTKHQHEQHNNKLPWPAACQGKQAHRTRQDLSAQLSYSCTDIETFAPNEHFLKKQWTIYRPGKLCNYRKLMRYSYRLYDQLRELNHNQIYHKLMKYEEI